MRWGEGTLKWIRPLHNVLCLLSDDNGSNVVDFNFGGLKANNKSRGHRSRGNREFSVRNFDDLKQKLNKAFVLLDHEERKKDIVNSASNLAFAIGLEVVEDQPLLNEVTNLVEWPNVLVGKISEEYLGLPSEVLQVSMRKHQKFFSLKNGKNNRIEGFVVVSNNETLDNGQLILEGNQRVLLARLSDAKFFLENDLRSLNLGMNSWVEKLKCVTYHHKLGSQFKRVKRIQEKSLKLAKKLDVDKNLVDQAVFYSKADLMSEMVCEFPELQGVMGRFYANSCGFSTEVSLAIKEHYSPLGPYDDCPKALVSVVVALSDKLETLESFWKIDQKPTGSKDPFALRRAALGVIRLLFENQISLKLSPHFSELESEQLKDLLSFIHERFRIFLRDKRIRHDIIGACFFSEDSDDIYTLYLRIKALADGVNSKIGRDLLQGFKRANNILKKAETQDCVSYELEPDSRFFEYDEEKKLFSDLDKTNDVITKKLLEHDFRNAFNSLAELSIPIDNFFDTVKVNSDSTIIRRNRLCLLHKIRVVCNKVADLNLIEG
jgi:glycyl-tRNA synthetase beta chain